MYHEAVSEPYSFLYINLTPCDLGMRLPPVTCIYPVASCELGMRLPAPAPLANSPDRLLWPGNLSVGACMPFPPRASGSCAGEKQKQLDDERQTQNVYASFYQIVNSKLFFLYLFIYNDNFYKSRRTCNNPYQ